MLKLGRVRVGRKTEFEDRLGIVQTSVEVRTNDPKELEIYMPISNDRGRAIVFGLEGEIPLEVGQEYMLALVPFEPDDSVVHVGPVS